MNCATVANESLKLATDHGICSSLHQLLGTDAISDQVSVYS